MSSINNLFDTVPFSISGLQDLAVDTINGSTVLATINIAGQTAYLSWDSTTSTLTLLIPTANGVVAGLLSATDWNTFNGKENLLTFSSPLTRVGNTVSFDFTQSLTFNGVTQTLNNNTIIGGNFFYTGATSATTGYILYIDNSTGFITKGAVPTSTNLLPLNNQWTGNYNEYTSRMIIYNINDDPQALRVYRNESLFVNEYLFYNNDGKLGINNGGFNWNIDRNGEIVAKSLDVTTTINASSDITTGNYFIGNGIDILTSYILLQNPMAVTNNFATLHWNTSTKEVGWAASLLGTNNTFAGTNTFNNDVNITIGGLTHVNFNSNYQTNWYEPTGALMSYLIRNGVTNLKWVVFFNPTQYCYYDTAANVLGTTSDERTKKNIRAIDIEKSKQFILSITPSIFQYKEGDYNNVDNIGFIAQDVLKCARTEAQRNIVCNWKKYQESIARGEEPKDILGVSATLIIPELVGTIQLLNKEIDQLRQDNKTLQERINAIQPTDMSAIEARLLKIENLIAKKKCLAFI